MKSLKNKLILTFGLSQTILAQQVLFEENFETFNLDTWQHEITLSGGGNWEFEAYMNNRSFSYVHDNTLFIKPGLMSEFSEQGEDYVKYGHLSLHGGADADYCTNSDSWGCDRQGDGFHYLNPVISARVRTLRSFSFKYGKVTFQAKMPRGDWMWPAAWLMPRHNQYGGWPSSGEIDILESRGNLRQTCGGKRSDISCVSSNLHWGPRYEYNRYYLTGGEHCKTDGSDYGDGFHNYELEWTENYIKTSVDGIELMNVTPETDFWTWGNFPGGMDNPWKYNSKMAPFDQEFYLIFNVAVGGTNGFFPDGCSNDYGAKPWSNTAENAPMQFWEGRNDWLRTWDRSGEDSAMQIRNLKVVSV